MDVPRFNVLGVEVHALTLPSATAEIVRAAQHPRSGYVCVTGVHGVIECQDDPALRDIHNRAFLVTPDGMPLVWLGPKGTQRVYGPDLILAVCEAGLTTGLRHFFYGGAPGVADELRDKLTTRWPELQVVGTHCPPFRELTDNESAALHEQVTTARPHIIWVGLSTPKQERFMAAHAITLDTGLLIGVGAAFDFHAGRKTQAPRWMQRSGLEWLYRLFTEPRRLAPRYLRNNPRFLWLLLKSRFTKTTKPL